MAEIQDILYRVEKLHLAVCRLTGASPNLCIEPGCTSPATCNYEGSAAAYCESHATITMDQRPPLCGTWLERCARPLIQKGRCTYLADTSDGPVQCRSKPQYGLPGQQPTRCRRHCELGYIGNPRARCVMAGCKSLATVAGSFTTGSRYCDIHGVGFRDIAVSTVAECTGCRVPTTHRIYDSTATNPYTVMCVRCEIASGKSAPPFPNEAGNREIRKYLEGLAFEGSGWQSHLCRPITTSQADVMYISDGETAVVVEYMDRDYYGEAFEEETRMRWIHGTVGHRRTVFVCLSCGRYRLAGSKKSVSWNMAFRELTTILGEIMGSPGSHPTLSYLLVFHNGYIRRGGFTEDTSRTLIP
jgi:hypothetical protein